MKILVTGGAGYLGSLITPFLLAEGFMVTVLDNFLFSQNSLMDGSACIPRRAKVWRVMRRCWAPEFLIFKSPPGTAAKTEKDPASR